MELVHARDLVSRDFLQISDGQKQRISLARAICQDPSVIILDEPASFLDIRYELEFLIILKDLVRRKRVVVFMSLHELDLAQKLLDYIVCVEGEYTERCGIPEEIFISSYITGLHGIIKGSYYAELGCPEIEPVKGKPQTFVVGGNGSGTPVYRRLQRTGAPLMVGILHENGVDHPIARASASQVIPEVLFESVREETYGRAAEVLASCGQAIRCLKEFGTSSDKNRKLAELGRDKRGADLLV